MTARRLFDAGYRDLVSVIPPDSRLAPTTGVRPEARGKVPGKRRLDGRWVGYPFTKEGEATEKDIVEWERWGSSIGLRAKHFPGLDVDVDHPDLAQLVVQEAQRELGESPVRTSRDPRRLLVYRTEEPFTRIAATITFQGEEHEVEALGEGRQYLVHGDHPSGSEYGWEDRPMWDWEPEEIPLVTREDVQEFFDHLESLLGDRADVERQGTGKPKDDSAPPQETLRAPSMEALLEVVEQIPNRFPDRESYIRVGHAIKAAGAEDPATAYSIFLDWAERWEDGDNEPETVEADWGRMHPPFRVGWSYLQDLAAKYSDYVPAQDAFEADPDFTSEGPAGVNEDGLIELTDSWVVERVARRIADRVRYVPEVGRYHVWGEG